MVLAVPFRVAHIGVWCAAGDRGVRALGRHSVSVRAPLSGQPAEGSTQRFLAKQVTVGQQQLAHALQPHATGAATARDGGCNRV